MNSSQPKWQSTYMQARYVLLLILQDAGKPVTVSQVVERLQYTHETAAIILDSYVSRRWITTEVVSGKVKPGCVKPPKERLYRLTFDGIMKARAEVRTRNTTEFEQGAAVYGLNLDVLNQPR